MSCMKSSHFRQVGDSRSPNALYVGVNRSSPSISLKINVPQHEISKNLTF